MFQKYPVKDKHEFYSSIYTTFHSNYNPETRIYTKQCENFDFFFKDNKLSYSKEDRADVKQALNIFKGINEKDITFNDKKPQERISYYLSNRLVPVSLN